MLCACTDRHFSRRDRIHNQEKQYAVRNMSDLRSSTKPKLSQHERVLWLVLQRKSEGKLCFEKVVNCGCELDKDKERLIIYRQNKSHLYCFSETIPCCAYIVSDFSAVQEATDHSDFLAAIVPPGDDARQHLDRLRRSYSKSPHQ